MVLEPARKVTADIVKQARGLDSDDDLPDIPESPQQRCADATANTPALSISREDFDHLTQQEGYVRPLDAVHVTCSMPPVLQLLIPEPALRFHAGVDAVASSSTIQKLL